MPRTDVVFYQEDGRDVPVLDWLKELRRTDQRAYESCVAAIGRLSELGHDLRRPLADILRNGIYELRIRKGRVNYRYALMKEDKVPKADIERAIRRKKAFEENPAQHSYSEEE